MAEIIAQIDWYGQAAVFTDNGWECSDPEVLLMLNTDYEANRLSELNPNRFENYVSGVEERLGAKVLSLKKAEIGFQDRYYDLIY